MSKKLLFVFISALLILAGVSAAYAGSAPEKLGIYYNRQGKGATAIGNSFGALLEWGAFPLKTTTYPAGADNSVRWSSSNEAVASFESESDTINLHKAGKSKICASSTVGKARTCFTLTVQTKQQRQQTAEKNKINVQYYSSKDKKWHYRPTGHTVSTAYTNIFIRANKYGISAANTRIHCNAGTVYKYYTGSGKNKRLNSVYASSGLGKNYVTNSTKGYWTVNFNRHWHGTVECKVYGNNGQLQHIYIKH